jgi:hypothetical protein
VARVWNVDTSLLIEDAAARVIRRIHRTDWDLYLPDRPYPYPDE